MRVEFLNDLLLMIRYYFILIKYKFFMIKSHRKFKVTFIESLSLDLWLFSRKSRKLIESSKEFKGNPLISPIHQQYKLYSYNLDYWIINHYLPNERDLTYFLLIKYSSVFGNVYNLNYSIQNLFSYYSIYYKVDKYQLMIENKLRELNLTIN